MTKSLSILPTKKIQTKTIKNNMEKELTIKDKVKNPIIIQHDDLKFDGKNINIPSYYIDSLCEYIKDYNVDGELEADIEDYKSFRSFLWDIQEYKNQGN